MGQIWLGTNFYMAYEPRMTLVVLDGWKKSSKEDFMTCENAMKLKFQFSVNKVSLARNHTCWCTHTSGCFLPYRSRSKELPERPYGSKSLKHLLSDPLRKKSADPWLLSIDSLPSCCWTWQMGSCCWKSEEEEGLWGISSLAFSLWSLCGLAEWASEGHSSYQVVLEIQNPFLLCAAVCPLPRPSRPRGSNVPHCS